MMMAAGPAEPIVTVAEAQAFARIETGHEEALLAGLIRTASGLCEAFLRQVVIERPFAASISATPDWQRLEAVPVRSIDRITSGGMALPATAYATDIDASGGGWVRIVDSAVNGTVEVSGTVGLASDENGVQEPIRQGVLRLVAHLFADRDGAGSSQIPAAVTALWRPYRRMSLS